MLKRIRIKNFQKHDKLDVEFSPNTTTIVGSSDSGKSAVIRALRWACLNKPNGNSFIRHGEKSCKVRIEVDDSQITRTKGSSNSYKLNDIKFEAFGTSVPDEIEDTLKLSDLNFQCQHDTPFWFSESAGQVSKNLNQIIDLSIIDKTLSEVASLVRKCKADVDATDRALQASQEQLNELEWTKDAAKEFSRIENLSEDKTSTHKQIQSMQLLICELKEANKKIESKEQFENDFNEIEKISKSIDDSKITELSEAIQEHKQIQISIFNHKARLSNLQSELDEIELCPTCQRPL